MDKHVIFLLIGGVGFFFGMRMMSEGLKKEVTKVPIVGVMAGAAVTAINPSSGATIAITQVIAFNGLISFHAALPLILGDNIGSTTTSQLAAIGTNLTARRTAMAHTLFNVIGVCYMLVFVYNGWYAKAIEFIIPGEITQYVIELSQRELSEEESREIPVLIHNVNDIERIGDHSENIGELAQSKFEKKIVFSRDLERAQHDVERNRRDAYRNRRITSE